MFLTEGRTEDLRVGGGKGALAERKSEMERVERRLAGEEAAEAELLATTTFRGDVGGGMVEVRDVRELDEREERAGEVREVVIGVGWVSLSEAEGSPKSSSGS